MIQARNGDIWIANNVYGLIRFSPQSGYAETPLYDINKDKKLIIQSLKESSTGDIWAISESHGVIQYSPMTKEIKVYQHDFQRLNSFFEKGGNTIEEAADGTIWVGMRQNGIQIIDPKKTIDQPLNAIGLADGLPNLTIIKILRDKQDNMWISTQNGMCAYIWTSKQIRRLGFGEHLADFSNQNKGFYRNTEGAFFLGGVKDFTVFNPETILSISHLSLNIRITDIKVLGNSVRIDQPIESVQRFEIEPSENYLTINFAAVESFNPSLINYRYRLNTTNEWINSGNQSELTFANLPDGDLDFEVQSTNEEGIWQNESALVRLYIRPYWYSSGWFRLLLITSVLTVGYSVYKNRIQTLQKKHDIALQINDLERTALAAQMNPHFIFNCLNSIQLLIQEGDKDNAMQYLGNFASLVRSTLESTRRGKISVLEEAQTLEHYLTLEKLRFKEGLKYSISIDTNIDTFDTELPAMLIQPFVENALKHGLSTEQSAQINIQFRKLNTYFLVIEITDNGKGFDTNCSKSDNTEGGKSRVGIALSRQRLALLNGREDKNDLKIVPLFDKTGEIKGTQVKMTVKVSQI